MTNKGILRNSSLVTDVYMQRERERERLLLQKSGEGIVHVSARGHSSCEVKQNNMLDAHAVQAVQQRVKERAGSNLYEFC